LAERGAGSATSGGETLTVGMALVGVAGLRGALATLAC
jgi:hypothetical protein